MADGQRLKNMPRPGISSHEGRHGGGGEGKKLTQAHVTKQDVSIVKSTPNAARIRVAEKYAD